jgi:hypothetical protein
MKSRNVHWIESVTAEHKGSFAADAKRHGESAAKFAGQEDSAPGKMGRRARLEEKLMSFNKKRGS